MKRPILLTTALITAGLLAGCTAAQTGANEESSQQLVAGASISDYDLATDAVLAANNDYTTVNTDEWSEADAVDVQLSGSGLAGSGAVQGVQIQGSSVTITEAGVYRLSGSLTGQILVSAPEDALVVLLLDGVTITNDSGSAIEVLTADDVAIYLADGSSNAVSDASAYADDAEANAAIWADTDLTISGEGSLQVNGNGNDGISSKDDLVILSGTISVTAADDALRGKDSLVVEGGTLSLTATGGDGLKSDGDDSNESAEIDWAKGYIYVRGGKIEITAGDDGVQAFTDTIIAGGELHVNAADDGVKAEVIVSIGLRNAEDTSEGPTVTVASSTEGIEAANIGISAGTIDMTASDDGINASGNGELQALIEGTEYVAGNREADSGERLEISGGSVTIVAAFDGLDSNGSITITGGSVDITAAERGGDGPIDGNGTIEVADGVVTANGAAWDASSAMMGPGGGGPGGMGGGPGGGIGGTDGQMPPGGEMPEMPAR